MTTAFVPEYIWQEALLKPEVRHVLDAHAIPQDDRPYLVRTLIHACAPAIVDANKPRR